MKPGHQERVLRVLGSVVPLLPGTDPAPPPPQPLKPLGLAKRPKPRHPRPRRS